MVPIILPFEVLALQLHAQQLSSLSPIELLKKAKATHCNLLCNQWAKPLQKLKGYCTIQKYM